MKKVLIVSGSIIVVLLMILLGAGWYFSSLIIDGMRITGETEEFDNQITAVTEDDGGGTVSYTVGEDVTDPATDNYTVQTVGMSFADGSYIQLAQDAVTEGETVTRTYTLLEGSAPSVGDMGRMDWNSWPDPASQGLQSKDVTYDAPLGETPAIIVEPSTTATGEWAVIVHGRNASVREGLRITPLLAEAGYTTMLLNYRDDKKEPGAPYEDGIGNFGYTEWSDVEAAVDYAQDQGAQGILLVAYSMGGAIVPSYLANGSNTDAVVGTIMHSPAVNFSDSVSFGAEQMGLPVSLLGPVIWTAERITEMRVDIDFDAVDYFPEAPDWPVPALVFACSEDDLVPPASIESWASELPDGQFAMFEGASHTGEWNSNEEQYNRTVNDWLDGLPG